MALPIHICAVTTIVVFVCISYHPVLQASTKGRTLMTATSRSAWLR